MTTKETKAAALAILNSNGSEVKLSDFTVRQARAVIREYNFQQNK